MPALNALKLLVRSPTPEHGCQISKTPPATLVLREVSRLMMFRWSSFSAFSGSRFPAAHDAHLAAQHAALAHSFGTAHVLLLDVRDILLVPEQPRQRRSALLERLDPAGCLATAQEGRLEVAFVEVSDLLSAQGAGALVSGSFAVKEKVFQALLGCFAQTNSRRAPG